MNRSRTQVRYWRSAYYFALLLVPLCMQVLAAAPVAAQVEPVERDRTYYDEYGNPLYDYQGNRVYYYDSDAGSCPRRLVLVFDGTQYRDSPYAGYAYRGADAYLGKVFYTFNNIPTVDKKWVASGNVYLYGWECRASTWINPGGALMPPHSRLELTESAAPNACSGGAGEEIGGYGLVVDVAYDPYASGGSNCGGGGAEGSGTQFNPGDYTGGETVDWGTGTGNGGSSVCGPTARVEFVCIDTFVDGVGWVEWDCGYVTSC